MFSNLNCQLRQNIPLELQQVYFGELSGVFESGKPRIGGWPEGVKAAEGKAKTYLESWRVAGFIEDINCHDSLNTPTQK